MERALSVSGVNEQNHSVKDMVCQWFLGYGWPTVEQKKFVMIILFCMYGKI
jgi:hypothetical protein